MTQVDGKIIKEADVRVDIDKSRNAPCNPSKVAWRRAIPGLLAFGLVIAAVAIGLLTYSDGDSTAPASCPAIDIVASTTTAGASCAGGVASGSPTCDFTCASGYYHTGASSITCGSDGVWPAHPTCGLVDPTVKGGVTDSTYMDGAFGVAFDSVRNIAFVVGTTKGSGGHLAVVDVMG